MQLLLTPLLLASLDTPPEYGRVDWSRKLEPALEAAKTSGKPVFLFFQEVPG